MLDAIDKTTIAISVSRLDLMALKKLSLVSHALATKLEFRASQEQKALADTLDDLIRRIEINSRS